MRRWGSGRGGARGGGKAGAWTAAERSEVVSSGSRKAGSGEEWNERAGGGVPTFRGGGVETTVHGHDRMKSGRSVGSYGDRISQG